MNLAEKINNKIKNYALRRNKVTLITSIAVMLFSVSCIFLFPKETVPQTIILNVYGLVFLLISIWFYLSAHVNLDEESLNKWFMSLPNSFSLIKEVESIINESWKSERRTFNLNEYEIVDTGKERYLTFFCDKEKVSLLISKIKYDNGKKRVEFSISDKDWTINIKKGSWVGVQIYNV